MKNMKSIKRKNRNNVKPAIKRKANWENGLKKGRVRTYIQNKYGKSGFNANGTLKISTLKQAEKTAKPSMKKAIIAAITLKGMRKK